MLILLSPHPCQRLLCLLFEAGYQIFISGHQFLLGFDLGDDGVLGGKRREGDCVLFQNLSAQVTLVPTSGFTYCSLVLISSLKDSE